MIYSSHPSTQDLPWAHEESLKREVWCRLEMRNVPCSLRTQTESLCAGGVHKYNQATGAALVILPLIQYHCFAWRFHDPRASGCDDRSVVTFAQLVISSLCGLIGIPILGLVKYKPIASRDQLKTTGLLVHANISQHAHIHRARLPGSRLTRMRAAVSLNHAQRWLSYPCHSSDNDASCFQQAAVFTLGFITLNWALGMMHVSLVMTLRATEPLFTLFLSAYLLKSERVSWNMAFSLFPVILGAALSSAESAGTFCVSHSTVVCVCVCACMCALYWLVCAGGYALWVWICVCMYACVKLFRTCFLKHIHNDVHAKDINQQTATV